MSKGFDEIELHQMRIFVKVVQAGSFTRAAELLQSQKAHLSRMISQLEKQLNVQLLVRSTRAMSLTETGQLFLEQSLRILDAVEDITRTVQQQHHTQTGNLRITCGTEFGMIAVSDWIHQYLAYYPTVTVEADFTNRLVDIVYEGVDVAIRLGELKDSNLHARYLGALHYGVYASPNVLSDIPDLTHPKQLTELPLCVFSGGVGKKTWKFTHAHTGEIIDVPLVPRLFVNNSFAVSHALIQGLGFGVLPHRIAQPLCETGQLHPVFVDWQLPTVAVHAVFSSGRYMTAKLRAFIDIALKNMNT